MPEGTRKIFASKIIEYSPVFSKQYSAGEKPRSLCNCSASSTQASVLTNPKPPVDLKAIKIMIGMTMSESANLLILLLLIPSDFRDL